MNVACHIWLVGDETSLPLADTYDDVLALMDAALSSDFIQFHTIYDGQVIRVSVVKDRIARVEENTLEAAE